MYRKVGDVVDKLGGSLTLYSSDSIANTPVVSLFLKVYAEIIDKGFANPNIPFNNKCRVVWVERPDGKVAGGICFQHDQEAKLSWIILSFTSPDERGKGINGICHDQVEKVSKFIGATQLCSLVHIQNESRLKSAKKVGFEPQYYRMFKKL